jgi:hypothetical protein
MRQPNGTPSAPPSEDGMAQALEDYLAAAEQAGDLARHLAAFALAGRLRTRRLELALKISQLAGPAVAELAEVLRDLEHLAQPTAALPAQRALLQPTPAPAEAAAVPAG